MMRKSGGGFRAIYTSATPTSHQLSPPPQSPFSIISRCIHAPSAPPPNPSEQTAHCSAEEAGALLASRLLPDVERAADGSTLRGLGDTLCARSPVGSGLGGSGGVAGALGGRSIGSRSRGSSLLGGSGLVGGSLVGGGLVGTVGLLASLGLGARGGLRARLLGRLHALRDLLLHRVAGGLGVAALGDGLRLDGLHLGVLGGESELLRLLGRVEGGGVELRGLGDLELGDLCGLCVVVRLVFYRTGGTSVELFNSEEWEG